MRWWLSIAVMTACGEPAIAPDAGQPPHDAPGDPFAGRFDEPSEFPRASCTANALAERSLAGYWPALGLRVAPGEAVVDAGGEDIAAAIVVATPDDLIVRATRWDGATWTLVAIDLCGIANDGAVVGAIARCSSASGGDAACEAAPFAAHALDRIAGEPEADHLALVGELRGAWDLGATARVRVVDDLALLARGADGIRIVSVASPGSPFELGHFHGGTRDIHDLEIVRGIDGRRYAITAGSPSSPIVDVTDPRAPQLVAEVASAARSVTVEGGTAYFVDGETSQLHVYDVSRPRAPNRLGTYRPAAMQPPIGWRGTFVAGAIVYAADGFGSGLHVIDARDPARPRELAAENAARGDAWHVPSLAVVAGKPIALDAAIGRGSKLRLLDADLAAAEPLRPLSEWSLRDEVSIHDLATVGARVFVAHQRDGVRVVDLANTAAPRAIGHFNTWQVGSGGAQPFEGARGIAVDASKRRVYVADSIRGLLVLQGDATIFP